VSEKDKQQSVLDSCLGQSQSLAALIEYADDSVVSKTILNKKVGTITLFAFDKGQGLSEHTSPYDAIVQVLDGSSQINIDSHPVEVSAGELIVMPANVPHSLDAQERFKMLLIMIRD
jgi:quercetin dioxygenase-like cupin family protein